MDFGISLFFFIVLEGLVTVVAQVLTLTSCHCRENPCKRGFTHLDSTGSTKDEGHDVLEASRYEDVELADGDFQVVFTCVHVSALDILRRPCRPTLVGISVCMLA